MRCPDGHMRDTLLWLDPASSGKPRLRSLARPQFQIGRMVASMLMMPVPRRDVRGLSSAPEILSDKTYVISKVGFATDASFSVIAESVEFTPNFVEIKNEAYSDLIGVKERWLRIAHVIGEADHFAAPISGELKTFAALLSTGAPINAGLGSVVKRISQSLASRESESGPEGDPLARLEGLLGLEVEGLGRLPAPDTVGEDESDVKRRAAVQYRQARVRGASARAFAKEVLLAYNYRCAVCGIALGGIEGIDSGIDAAHILAWSKYDLDVVQNGIALCKLHHWAFDECVQLVVESEGVYFVRFTQLASRVTPAAREMLGADNFRIPDSQLPADQSKRPSRKYLSRLLSDLSIEF